jgi:hypothetical protein
VQGAQLAGLGTESMLMQKTNMMPLLGRSFVTATFAQRFVLILQLFGVICC